MAIKPAYEKLKQKIKELEEENLEHRQTKEALTQKDALYKDLFDNTINGIAVYKATDKGKDFILADINKTQNIEYKMISSLGNRRHV